MAANGLVIVMVPRILLPRIVLVQLDNSTVVVPLAEVDVVAAPLNDPNPILTKFEL